MKRKKLLALGLTLLLVLAISGAALAQQAALASSAINWHVVSSGGAASASASYQVTGTFSQFTIGPSQSSASQVKAGFWYGWLKALYYTLLPVVIR